MDSLKFEGISVATVGPAVGHAMMVDDQTLLQAQEAGQAGSPVKVFLDHEEKIDSLIGFLENFRIVDDQLRADLDLIGAHPQSAFYQEILKKAPNRVGFSMTFSGMPEEQDGQRFARVAELVSVDLVSRPAANKNGVFRAASEPAALPPVDTELGYMPHTPEKKEKEEFDAQAAFEALSATVSELAAAVKAMQPKEDEEEEKDEKKMQDSEATSVAQEALAALSSKVADLEIALAAKGADAVQASALSSEDPVEQFKAASEAKDWKRVTQIFSAHKAAIHRARNAKTF